MKTIKRMRADGLCIVKCAEINKRDACWMLEGNTHNRCANKDRVAFLKKIMDAGDFVFNGDTIVFDASGVLIDGQTRLMAFVESECKSLTALIVYLAKSGQAAYDVQKTIDRGRPRTYAQQLTLDGVRNSSKVASWRRAILIVESGLARHSMKFTDSEMDTRGKLYEREIAAFSKFSENTSYINRFNALTIGVLCVFAKKHNAIESLVEWCEPVASMVGLERGTTQYTFARILSTLKGTSGGKFGDEVVKKVTKVVKAHFDGNEHLSKVYE